MEIVGLDATFTVSLDTSPIARPTVLTFTFSNGTAIPAEFSVKEILFDIPDKVTSLSRHESSQQVAGDF